VLANAAQEAPASLTTAPRRQQTLRHVLISKKRRELAAASPDRHPPVRLPGYQG